MKTNFICLLILGLSFGAGKLLGQVVYDLNFQACLTDIEGQRIANESFDLKVQLKRASGSEALFEFSSVSKSDEEGWFGFNINEVSKFLDEKEPFAEALLIEMEFLPNSGTKWIKSGEDFLLTYRLSSLDKEGHPALEMSRMEGSKLMVHEEEHLFAFKDEYPFAYITGGFLLTDNPPLDQELINDLKKWIIPEESEEEGAASRGVKGGFPTGGYYKKK